MEQNDFAVMIPTAKGREVSLQNNLECLLKEIKDPLTVYIYNDLAGPLDQLVQSVLKRSNRKDVQCLIMNENNEISSVRVGAGGARYYLFEKVKDEGHQIVASLDDDNQITAGWYENILRAIEEFPDYSVFSSLLQHVVNGRNQSLHGGLRIVIDGVWLKRSQIRSFTDDYTIADWSPIGAMVFCREALKPEVKFPIELMVGEDAVMYLLLRKLGINQTVVANKALVKDVKTTKIKGFRTQENLREAARYIWKNYGVSMIKDWRRFAFVPKPNELEKIRVFLDDPAYPKRPQ